MDERLEYFESDFMVNTKPFDSSLAAAAMEVEEIVWYVFAVTRQTISY